MKTAFIEAMLGKVPEVVINKIVSEVRAYDALVRFHREDGCAALRSVARSDSAR